MRTLEFLVYVPEDCRPDFAGSRYQAQEFFAVSKTDRVKPLAADGQWRVMQANQCVVGCRFIQQFFKPFHFLVINASGGIIAYATVDTGD